MSKRKIELVHPVFLNVIPFRRNGTSLELKAARLALAKRKKEEFQRKIRQKCNLRVEQRKIEFQRHRERMNRIALAQRKKEEFQQNRERMKRLALAQRKKEEWKEKMAWIQRKREELQEKLCREQKNKMVLDQWKKEKLREKMCLEQKIEVETKIDKCRPLDDNLDKSEKEEEEEEDEEGEEEEEKSERKEKYPMKLVRHLKPMSINQNELELDSMFSEWDFIYVKDKIERDECPCGKEDIRYLCYIENRFTHCETFVGTKCIEWFNENLAVVAEVARALLTRGVQGMFQGESTSDTHPWRFRISEKNRIVRECRIFETLFKHTGIYQEGSHWEIHVRACMDRTFKIGESYILKLSLQRFKAGICFNLVDAQRVQTPGTKFRMNQLVFL